MQFKSTVVLTVFTLLGAPVGAQVFQCTDSKGAVSFQDTACDSGSRVLRRSQPAGVAGLRNSERAWLKQLKHRQAARPNKAVPKSRKKERARQQQACWKKQTQLDEVRARLRRGYKASQGDKLRRRRRTYEGYLSRYCD